MRIYSSTFRIHAGGWSRARLGGGEAGLVQELARLHHVVGGARKAQAHKVHLELVVQRLRPSLAYAQGGRKERVSACLTLVLDPNFVHKPLLLLLDCKGVSHVHVFVRSF